MVLRCRPLARYLRNAFSINLKEILKIMVLIFLFFGSWIFFPNIKKPGIRLVYLKMVSDTLYEVCMFYQKLKKWSSVWLIKYVWFNIFWLFGPKYVLIPTYGLFETEEYMKSSIVTQFGLICKYEYMVSSRLDWWFYQFTSVEQLRTYT